MNAVRGTNIPGKENCEINCRKEHDESKDNYAK